MIPWRAQPGPQLTAVQHHEVSELLYGGAVFGGKSDFLLGDFAQDVPGPYGKYWHGILFRKTYPELEDMVSRSKEIYPAWFPGVRWGGSSKEHPYTWIWPNGATLKMRYLESEDDYLRYWGHAYTWIGWDELGLWASPIPYLRMKARLRCAQYPIPNMRVRASANPGGAGHQWVKTYFGIDRWPLGGHVFDGLDEDGNRDGMRRLYIKARMSDNKIGMQNDPGYSKRMDGIGSKAFVRALKDGDWDVVAGAFFDEWRADKHVIKPFSIPQHWTRMRWMDWGSSKPFCVLWAAVSDGEIATIPRGALVVYREWYGVKTKPSGEFEPNVGLKMKNELIGAGIIERESYVSGGQIVREKIDVPVIDPACFATEGGPSIVEQMGLNDFAPADNTRIPGWSQLRLRLAGDDDGRPMIYFFDTCIHTIRTVPALQHDKHKPEDVDTDSEDHPGDTVRYGCMARPWIKDLPSKSAPKWPLQQSTTELLAARRRARLQREE